eukprot:gnl/MRDRNA2_/MRDRNA2_27674_c0_seq2.p1 gnl/MRDRNA2_/MRDRNA2_27674_c0~~gnl/MRDRNA2_/MRDRNA2_27674_c0_seq2.p1  ORF type:complete len:257 (+),score=29.18 gnl/MRDRNA2_/MRDRNA2_27674_c0_seq2:76-846(+)
MLRAVHVLQCLFSLRQGAMLETVRSAGKGDSCELPSVLHLQTQDELSLEVKKANCDTDKPSIEDGSVLTCRLDPTGTHMVPNAMDYALQGGMYRQGQSMLDKEFIIHCCAGQLSLERGPHCKEQEIRAEHQELFIHEPSKCPDARSWVYFDHEGRTGNERPRSEEQWDDLHTSLTNATISEPCMKIANLGKTGGYSDRSSWKENSKWLLGALQVPQCFPLWRSRLADSLRQTQQQPKCICSVSGLHSYRLEISAVR